MAKTRYEITRDQRARVKTRAVEYLGGKCLDCDLIDDPCVYDIHHLDPAMKDFGISGDGRGRAWETVRAELDKCVLLCANCHRKRHSRRPKPVPLNCS